MSKLALLGGDPVCENPPRTPWPAYDDHEKQGLLEVLESRVWGGFPEPAPKAALFAERFAAYHDAAHGICCTNGSVSLEIALNALDIEAGDEVIVPTYTWIATGASAIHVNAVPVFVDVEPHNYCMDPEQVEAAITPRTRAIIPVHLGANIADLDRLLDIAKRHGLAVIEDCAHAHGGKWRGKGVGSHGDFGSFSMQISKLMTCGEGGLITTSNDELAARAHWVVNCGRKDVAGHFPGHVLGVNARMTEFQAAILLGQFSRLEADTAQRERGLAYLEAGLKEVGGLVPLERDARITSRNAYELIFKYQPEQCAGIHRDVFLKALTAEGVECDGDFYVPMHEHELFHAESRHWPFLRERYGHGMKDPETQRKLNFPVASRAAYEEAVWMHYPYLMASQEAMDRVIEAVHKVKTHAAELRQHV